MRSKTFLIILIVAIGVHGQKALTPRVEQNALNRAKEFCSLLTRWSNGERTLDTKIYALCSGSDCSAYDDISSMKETTLRNYLLSIQKKYPKSLSMQISTPSKNKCKKYTEGGLDIYVKGDFEKLEEKIGYEIWPKSSMSTRYLAFSVTQNILQKETKKIIIYDIDKDKITAFVNGDGTLISFLDGIYVLDFEHNIKGAISKFLYAANNPRFSLKNKALLVVSILYSQLGDYASAISYAEKSGVKYYYNFLQAERAFAQKKYNESISFLEKCEGYIRQFDEEDTRQIDNEEIEYSYDSLYEKSFCELSKELEVGRSELSYVHYCIGLSYLLGGNCQNAISYLSKSANEGFLESGYCLYKYKIQTNRIGNNYMNYQDMIDWLSFSAKRGYKLAEFEYGVYKQYVEKKKTEAIYWYYESINDGIHPLAKACLGKLCIESKNGLPKLGWIFLKESLSEGLLKSYSRDDIEIGFQKYLIGYKERLTKLSNGQFWINSSSDVRSLLRKYEQYASSNESSVNDTVNNDVEFSLEQKDEYRQLRRWYFKFKREHPDKIKTQ